MAGSPPDAEPSDGTASEPIVEAAATLLAAIDAALAGWVERSVARLMVAFRGDEPDDVRAAAAAAGQHAREAVVPVVAALLAMDVDEQRQNPLALLRSAVRYPTEVLAAAGVPAVVRDEFVERAFPDDIYDLSPASWRDIDESLHEPGIIWGAVKAKTVLDRRRSEGLR